MKLHIQQLLAGILVGLLFFWRGEKWIAVKGLEASAVGESFSSALFCAFSALIVFLYAVLRKKSGMGNVLLIHFFVLALLANLFIQVTHNLYWHSLLVNASGALMTIFLFEAYFLIRRIEDK
jgi:hypothetical protein